MVKPSLCQPSDSFFRYKCVLLLYRKQNSKKNVLNGPTFPSSLHPLSLPPELLSQGQQVSMPSASAYSEQATMAHVVFCHVV